MSLFNQKFARSLKFQSAKIVFDIVRDNVIDQLQGTADDAIIVGRELDRLAQQNMITIDIVNFLKEHYYYIGHRETVKFGIFSSYILQCSPTWLERAYANSAALQMAAKIEEFREAHSNMNMIPEYRVHCQWRPASNWNVIQMSMVQKWVWYAYETMVYDKQVCPEIPRWFAGLLLWNYIHHVTPQPQDQFIDAVEPDQPEDIIPFDLDNGIVNLDDEPASGAESETY